MTLKKRQFKSLSITMRQNPSRFLKRILLSFFVFMLTPFAALALEIRSTDIPSLIFRQNLAVLSAAYGPQIAESEVLKSRAIFDTQVFAQASYNLDQSEKESIVFGDDNRSAYYEAGVEQRFPIGVQGALRFSQNYQTTNSPFATMNSYWDSRVKMDLRANLLKNRGSDLEKRVTELARSEKDIAQSQTREVVDLQSAQALTVYWNWVASTEYVRLSRKFLKLSETLSLSLLERKKLGLVEDGDWWATQASVADRKNDLLQAEKLRENLEDQLRFLLQLNPEEKLSTSDKLSSTLSLSTVEELLAQARQNRPDYQLLLKQAQKNNLQLEYSKKTKAPELDLVSSLELNGLQSEYATALRHQWEGQGPNVFAGFQFRMNLNNREAQAEIRKNELRKAQLLLEIKGKEQQMEMELKEALREARLHKMQALNSLDSAKAQSLKYEAELGKVSQARSNLDSALRYQGDFLEAERRRLDSLLKLRLAEVDVQRRSRGWMEGALP